MEAEATSILVARDPPSQKTAHLGQGQGPAQPGWARGAFLQTLCFLLTSGFLWGLHRAGCDLGFAVTTTYALAVLCVYLWKLELLRHDPTSTARGRRRVGLAASAVSLALVSNVTLHVARLVPSLALKVALLMVAGLAMGIAFYLLLATVVGGARAEDAGRWPEKDLYKLSPEQKV